MPILVEALSTPHLTQSMPVGAKRKLRESYRKCKKYGIRSGIGVITGGSVCQIGYEICKGELKTYGKKKIGGVLIATSAYVFSGSIVLATNATRIAKYANATHKVCAAAYRTAHNIAELPTIFIDYAVFGEYIPSCEENDYNWFNYDGNGIEEFFDN